MMIWMLNFLFCLSASYLCTTTEEKAKAYAAQHPEWATESMTFYCGAMYDPKRGWGDQAEGQCNQDEKCEWTCDGKLLMTEFSFLFFWFLIRHRKIWKQNL